MEPGSSGRDTSALNKCWVIFPDPRASFKTNVQIGVLGRSATCLVLSFCLSEGSWATVSLSVDLRSFLLLFPQCREALTTRQKLIAQDYKVSYSLAKSCKSDLKKYRCNVENLPRSREARLSYLLMCLESAVHRGDVCFLFPCCHSFFSSHSEVPVAVIRSFLLCLL